eukprot:CAMPEP_0179300018 /NCGR_PEP_ID=MMETSP0797-20121207/46816_1 /TAXON_ID=47934 /ORGANISM="Dinophysis acuminata, Strain DAEP01" /LENGTH=371 /DNA_ID=CAMNT_0021009471 /DNA_START=59 /DNA_END=1170 /DNA_ORIENTATION=+
MQKDAINRGDPPPSLRWWTGIFLVVVAAGSFESTALAYAPLSILSPMFCLAVVFNAPIAICYLGETISCRSIAATLVVVCGTVGTAVFGSHEHKSHTPAEILAYAGHRVVQAYSVSVVLVVVASRLAVRRIRELVRKGEHQLTPFQAVHLEEEKRHSVAWKFSALVFANFAGVLGAQQTLCLKVAADTIAAAPARTSSEGRAGLLAGVLGRLRFGDGDAAAIGASLALVCAFGIWYLAVLNEGLRLHDAGTYAAQFKALSTVYGCLAGAVVFEEFYGFGAGQGALFVASVTVVVGGLFLFPAQGAEGASVQPAGEDTPKLIGHALEPVPPADFEAEGESRPRRPAARMLWLAPECMHSRLRQLEPAAARPS